MKIDLKKALPLIIAGCLAIGILVGNFFAVRSLANKNGSMVKIPSNGRKTDVLLNLIENQYVDSVDTRQIEEKIIPEILKNLDPHSAYIPAKDIEEFNEDLSGSFSGIGVQFHLQSDTIYVVDVIRGGPSERAGLIAGDRIVEINDTVFVGKEINNEKVMKKLRGKKNTTVKLGIKRRNSPELLPFRITRDDIPVKSVESAYMATPSIGYIYISKFGANTYGEFLTAIAKLKKSGADHFVIDLRGNAGGYLEAVINMVNEFLSQNQLIVYTQGKDYPRSDVEANGIGSCKAARVAVLIDEFSGSASEIFAGAIQDNDRGIIIGRRSFGKGLVQQQIPFSDKSAVRLTIARYYTPSGRCIQKHYEPGKLEEYDKDIMNRYQHGEFYSQDSIRQTDSLAYKTRNGRTVFGGGGIMPDIFVPSDTTETTAFFTQLFNHGTLYKFALNYAENHMETLKKQGDWKNLTKYLDQKDIMGEMTAFAAKQKITGSANDLKISGKRIKKQLYAYIVRNILGDDGFYPLINQDDKSVTIAIKKLENTNDYDKLLQP